MTTSAELDKIVEEVRSTAQAMGAKILDAVLSLEQNAVPVAVVDGSELGSLISHLRPRLVYLTVVPFDAREGLDAMLGGESPDGVNLRRLIARWNSRKGQTARIACSVMGEGVLHATIEASEWLEEFETEAEKLISELREIAAQEHERAQEAERLKADAQERKRLGPSVKKLIADVRFSAPKTSVAKRLALAESIFPELDRSTLKKIVDRASSELWLSSSRNN